MMNIEQPNTFNAWANFADKGDIKSAIEAYVSWYGDVTFGELVDVLENCCAISIRGACVISEANNSNLILWDDVSKEFAQAISELFQSKTLRADITNEIQYFSGGYGLDLPIADTINPTEPMWLPVSISATAQPGWEISSFSKKAPIEINILKTK